MAQTKRISSLSQMRIHMASYNMKATYDRLKYYITGGFEDNPKGYTDYDMFIKLNMNNRRTYHYLSKNEVDNGKFHIGYPYQITQGSLPSITYTRHDVEQGVTYFTSNISIGSLNINYNTTTVGQFAQAVVENNENYEYGDQITFICGIDYSWGNPFFEAKKITLKQNSQQCLSDVITSDTNIYYGFQQYNGFLAIKITEYEIEQFTSLTFAWIHSRYNNEKLSVSTQCLCETRYSDDDYQLKSVMISFGYDPNDYTLLDENKYLLPEDAIQPEEGS